MVHPAAACSAVASIEADALCADGSLRLSWRLEGDIALLRMPAVVSPAVAGGLWRHTCFEAFIAPARAPGYWEFNFSPSGEWAAYGFSGYRSGMSTLGLPAAPEARWQTGAHHLALDVALRAEALPAGMAAGVLRVGLAAVVEEQSGTITHWALAHPDGKPDFHRPAGFAFQLAMPGGIGAG